MTSHSSRARARARTVLPLAVLVLLVPAGCSTTHSTAKPDPSSVATGGAPQVSGEPAGSLLVSPVAYDVGGVVEATFDKPIQGQSAILQRKEGSSWTTVADSAQDANGRVDFTVPFDAKATYRAVTPATGTAAATATASADGQWQSTLRDDFKGTSVDTKTWSGHNDGLYYGPRLCAASYPDMRSVKDGKLVMVTAPATAKREAKARANAECKYGVYDGAIVSTEKSYEFQYGIVAARVKFSPDPGQHAAVWLQSYYPDGGEIDILESFGYKRGIQNKTHRVLADGTVVSDGGYIPNNTPKTDRAWWDAYHVVSVEWTKEQYVFRVDGVETMRTNKGISQAKDFLMISWGSSDWELPRMDASKLPSTTYVDWVGVWQEK
jgi:beta-glucanase (GH16 family)